MIERSVIASNSIRFESDDFDFFIVGNVEMCRPCRVAHDRLRKFVRDHPEYTFGEWKFDWETKSVWNSSGRTWLKEQRELDPVLAGHKTIPMVWVNGKFVGGRKELFEILDNLER